jgi:hypothetical protein
MGFATSTSVMIVGTAAWLLLHAAIAKFKVTIDAVAITAKSFVRICMPLLIILGNILPSCL